METDLILFLIELYGVAGWLAKSSLAGDPKHLIIFFVSFFSFGGGSFVIGHCFLIIDILASYHHFFQPKEVSFFSLDSNSFLIGHWFLIIKHQSQARTSLKRNDGDG